MKFFIPLLLAVLALSSLQAQTYVPGQSYFSPNGYIEYVAGNMPLILCAPHGGYLTPDTIPDRDCAGCVYVRDGNTQELTRAAAEAIHELTGCYPHVVINRLHRRKLDANRDLAEAADSNAIAGAAWYAFHAFLDSARAQITATRGRGLFIDVHGHGHTIQRLELGYLLTGSELRLTDSQINAQPYLGYSSIQTLVGDNLEDHSHAELIRGEHSLGELMHQRGYPAVPSQADPFPDADEPYFNGGYNTNRYGSDDGGNLDAIQIECNNIGVRDNLTNVNRFADTLAVGLVAYMQQHYYADAPNLWCQPTSSLGSEVGSNISTLKVYPNPFVHAVRMEVALKYSYSVRFYDVLGRLLTESGPHEGAVQLLPPNGVCWVAVTYHETGMTEFARLVQFR
jgi:N-formylglutamate amidohydrolase